MYFFGFIVATVAFLSFWKRCRIISMDYSSQKLGSHCGDDIHFPG